MISLNKDMPVFPERKGTSVRRPIHDPATIKVEEWSFEPGVQFYGHPHEVSEITYVIKGKMRLKQGGEEFVLESGCYYYTAAGAVHQIIEIIEPTTILIVGTPSTTPKNRANSYH